MKASVLYTVVYLNVACSYLTHLQAPIHDLCPGIHQCDLFWFSESFQLSTPHARLLLKLQTYGIEGNLLKWIENYLSGPSRNNK